MTAIEETSNTQCAIRITNDKGVGRLTPEQIQALLRSAEQYKMQDSQVNLKHKARSRLVTLCTQIREAVKNLATHMTEKEQLKVLKDLDYTETWLESESQSNMDLSAAQLMKEYKALDRRVNTVLSKAYTAYIAAGNPAPPSTERARNSNSNAVTQQ